MIWGELLLDWFFGPVDAGTGSRRARKGIVPDVIGFDVAGALEELWADGFKVEVRRLEPHPAPVMGIVESQAPAAGTDWNRARNVRLNVRHPPAVDRGTP